MGITLTFRRTTLVRLASFGLFILIVRWTFFSTPPSNEITHHNVIDLARGADKTLDVKKYPFLQSRQGRDDMVDILSAYVDDGTEDFWSRFQLPL